MREMLFYFRLIDPFELSHIGPIKIRTMIKKKRKKKTQTQESGMQIKFQPVETLSNHTVYQEQVNHSFPSH